MNTTDIVTAAALVERCGAVALAGGARLEEVAVDPVLGIAVLAQETRSTDWLPLAATPGRAREAVTLIGRGADGATLRDGRLEGDATGRRVRHDLRVGPGGSGAPLIDFDDRVVAVAVDEPGRSGAAVTARALAGFLDEVAVPFRQRDARPIRPAQRAVVALECAGR